MRYICDAATDIGKQRDRNEDAVFWARFHYSMWHGSDDSLLAIVADGMGGHSGGEVASKMATVQLASLINYGVNFWLKYDREMLKEKIGNWMRKAMVQTNQRIVEGGKNPETWRMGSTATVAYFVDDLVYCTFLGDCRFYILQKGGKLEQLTEDHTIAWVLYKNKEIKKEEIPHHPARNRLTRHLGMEELSEDWIGFVSKAVETGSRFLICSDGLYDMVSEGKITEILESGTAPKECCHALINAANDAGGDDNISVVVIFAEE